MDERRIPWDAPSRFGRGGRLARAAVQRVMKPALVRQERVDSLFDERLAALEGGDPAGRSYDLGVLLHRVDVLERRAEVAAAEAVAAAAPLPRPGERIMIGTGRSRKVLASGATGPHLDLLRLSVPTLERYARRHGWDLLLSGEDLTEGRPPAWGKIRLAQELLREYEVVAWIDADAIIVDLERDLAEELRDGKDFYLAEHDGGDGRHVTANTGVFMVRRSGWSERFLEAVWGSEQHVDHEWWENAAVLELLGYELDGDTVRRGAPTEHGEHVAYLDLAWNSVPYWARSPRPRINHYGGGASVATRRALMLDDLVRALDPATTSTAPESRVRTREDLPALLNALGLTGTGAEIGVRNGDFSAWILQRWSGRHLISVDPWSEAPGDEYVDISNAAQARHDDLFVQTSHRLAHFAERSGVWRMTSEQAARTIEDGALDFVYLDARHDEASVAEDLELWIDKVKPGGVFAGHDYLDGDLPQGEFGVKTAVDRFFGRRGVAVNVTEGDAPWSSWWVVLPRP